MEAELKEKRRDQRRRVALGVKLLDRLVPKWYQKVKLKKFELSDPCQCVLGQIGQKTPDADWQGHTFSYTSFGLNLAASDNAPTKEPDFYFSNWAADHGFDKRAFSEDAADYGYLQKLWTKAIEKRKGVKRG